MYLLSPEDRVVVAKFGRKLTFADVRNYAESLLTDPRFDPSFSEIADLAEVQEIALTADQIIKLADIADPFQPGAKRAFVACTDMQIRAARMHQMLRNDEVNIRIFSTYREARHWISSTRARVPTASASI